MSIFSDASSAANSLARQLGSDEAKRIASAFEELDSQIVAIWATLSVIARKSSIDPAEITAEIGQHGGRAKAIVGEMLRR
jgi:hypothetical protein